MNYKIPEGAYIVAILHDGRAIVKRATRARVYRDVIKEGNKFVFKMKPGSKFREFKVARHQVIVSEDIMGLSDGTFTVIFTDDSYVTVKIKTDKDELRPDGSKNFFHNKKIISYLSGPDNEKNFTGFAHLDEDGGLHVWKNYQYLDGMAKYEAALMILSDTGIIGQAQAGMAYALRSSRCWRCNKKLTVPTSLHQGMGPDCAKKGW